MASDTIQEAIESAGKDAIKRAMADGHSVEGRSITELIEADKYLRAQTAAASGIGIRFYRTVPPGAI